MLLLLNVLESVKILFTFQNYTRKKKETKLNYISLCCHKKTKKKEEMKRNENVTKNKPNIMINLQI